jgi:electron transfer flavoprotein alpha subunit
LKTAVISTQKDSLNRLAGFLADRKISSEETYLLLDLKDGFASDGLELIKSNYSLSEYDLFLLSDSDSDQEFAVSLSIEMNGAHFTSCADIENINEVLHIKRQVYGGLVHLHLEAANKPVIASIAKGVLDASNTNEELSLDELQVKTNSTKSRIVARKEIMKTVDIASAKRIVSIGRGLQKQEDLELIEGIAKVLDAEIGCSRPLSEDFKWLPVERQVGLTGETVKPDIYLALGISGQVQHQVGMRDAKIVVAINNNKSAPIFQSCDYGIVGDLYEIGPMIKAALSK